MDVLRPIHRENLEPFNLTQKIVANLLNRLHRFESIPPATQGFDQEDLHQYSLGQDLCLLSLRGEECLLGQQKIQLR